MRTEQIHGATLEGDHCQHRKWTDDEREPPAQRESPREPEWWDDVPAATNDVGQPRRIDELCGDPDVVTAAFELEGELEAEDLRATEPDPRLDHQDPHAGSVDACLAASAFFV